MKARAPAERRRAGRPVPSQAWGEIPDTLQVSLHLPELPVPLLDTASQQLRPERRPRRGAVRQLRHAVPRHEGHAVHRSQRLPRHAAADPQEEPNQPPPPPTTDSRQPGFYYTTEILPEVSDSSVQHGPHVRNFLDCVKSRKRPNADIEDGHYTNIVIRLGNIAYRVGRTLQWDASAGAGRSTTPKRIGLASGPTAIRGSQRDCHELCMTRSRCCSCCQCCTRHASRPAPRRALRFTKRQLFVNPTRAPPSPISTRRPPRHRLRRVLVRRT